MVTHDDDKRSEESFDLFASMLLAFGSDDDETRVQEVQDGNLLMIHTAATTNTFSLSKRKIDDDRESKNQENTSLSPSLSLVESKRRRLVVSDDEPIRAQPIREIKPRFRERKIPVKRKAPVKSREPVRREPVVTPGWVIDLMKTFNGEGDAKMIFEKVLTKTDLTPNQGRLLMPFNQMSEKDFLTEAELKILEEHHKHKGDHVKIKGVDVVLLNRGGDRKWNLNMRIWKMKTTFNYALRTGWNSVVLDNNLQRNQTITLWSFHSHDGTLYFAFDPPTQDEAMSLALVPVTHAASSSSSMAPFVTRDSYNPFVCEETKRRLYSFPKRSRTPRVFVQITGNLEGLALNRTPPPECTEMSPNLEAVQETHIRSTSHESVTETTMDLELQL